MAPGCTIINNQCQTKMMTNQYTDSDLGEKHNQIPLPPTPAPPQNQPTYSPQNPNKVIRKPSFRSLETVDSFEILEQTIMKQKRLGKFKNTDLRMKILLKRTFNLVCEMMDRENGFNGSDENENEDHELENKNINIPEKEDFLENTLIINLNESESLDSTFQSDYTDELNFIELENFNYENLLENEANNTESNDSLDKNKSFLNTDFFSSNSLDSDINNSTFGRYKRRRSSADDDENDLEGFHDMEKPNNSADNFYLFNDLTNKNNRYLKIDESPNKKFKESINIVT